MAKAGFSFEIKTSFRSSLYAGAKRYNSFSFRMGTVVLEYPTGNVKRACFFLRKY
jgi:hypothetical protein